MKSKDVKRLTADWYQKLANEGFKDIEWYDPRTGKGQNTTYLSRHSSKLVQKYSQNTQLHYQMCQNFCTHYQFPSKKDQFILECYTNGDTYRTILRKLRDKGKGYGYDMHGNRSISLLTLHKLIVYYIKLVHKWNETNVEGLLHPDYIASKPD